MVISSLRKMLRQEECAFTKGEQKWDYLYSADAAKAMYLLAEKGKDGKTYVIGSGKARELKDYISVMSECAKAQETVRLGAVPYAEKQVMYLCADISALSEDTGFAPAVSFRDGIMKTIEYIKEDGKQ